MGRKDFNLSLNRRKTKVFTTLTIYASPMKRTHCRQLLRNDAPKIDCYACGCAPVLWAVSKRNALPVPPTAAFSHFLSFDPFTWVRQQGNGASNAEWRVQCCSIKT